MATVQALSGPVIRAVPFEEATVRNWDTCEGVDRLLIDSARAGSGTAFDHEALEPMLNALTTPIIVAGGLTPESIGDVIRRLRPWGVDVSSGVESAPGIKNPALIHEFCAAVHEADDAAN
jgi:phosphoribosylanthranilate isomerase